MDKYQEYIFKTSRSYYGLSVCGKSALEKVIVDDKIIFKQNDDITISDYILYIANIGIKSVFAIVGAKETPLAQELDPVGSSPKSGNQNRFFLPISFDNKIDAIKIVFKNNLADDLIFPVIYEGADKEKYYAKKEQERKDGLLKAADIKFSTGADLVNIYFQPCCDKYEYSEIFLFVPKEEIVKGYTSRGKKVVEIPSWSMIKKCKVPSEDFYKSIGGLAYGTYSFIVKQFDSQNKLLLETDHIEFKINAATPVGHIRPTNVIC